MTEPAAERPGAGRLGASGDAPGRQLGMSELRSLLTVYDIACIDGRPVTGAGDVTPGGKELRLGGVRDAQWGPVLMVGLGGIYVEVVGDTAVALAPVSPAEATALLDELRIAPLLDRPALAGIISRFSHLLVDLPELTEIEINPLMTSPDGAVAVDVRARLGA